MLPRRIADGLLPEQPTVESPWHPLQSKAHTEPAAQAVFILDAHQRLDPFSIRIQQHERRIAHVMAASKGTPLGRIQIRQDKSHLPMKLRSERVDDTLELGTVRSARQKHLHDGWLFADNVEATIPGLPGQHYHRHNGHQHHWDRDEKRQPPPLAALTLHHGLLPRCLVTLPHRFFSCGGALVP
jgi:hypothetical protein